MLIGRRGDLRAKRARDKSLEFLKDPKYFQKRANSYAV